MPKGQYRRKHIGYKRKRNRTDWRAKKESKCVVGNGKVLDYGKIPTRNTNPAPAKRKRTKPKHKTFSSELTEKEKRMQIYLYWAETLDFEPPSRWKGHDGTISTIINQLGMPVGSRKTVSKTLATAWAMHVNGLRYEGDSAKVGAPSNNPLGVKRNSIDEQILADAIEDGFSIRRAHEVVNRNRRELNPDAKDIGYSAIRSAVERLNPTKTG